MPRYANVGKWLWKWGLEKPAFLQDSNKCWESGQQWTLCVSVWEVWSWKRFWGTRGHWQESLVLRIATGMFTVGKTIESWSSVCDCYMFTCVHWIQWCEGGRLPGSLHRKRKAGLRVPTGCPWRESWEDIHSNPLKMLSSVQVAFSTVLIEKYREFSENLLSEFENDPCL